jgi:hypothetical protein
VTSAAVEPASGLAAAVRLDESRPCSAEPGLDARVGLLSGGSDGRTRVHGAAAAEGAAKAGSTA